MHEDTVSQPFGADSSVNPLNPQRTKIALVYLAVAIGILPGLFDSLAGDADRILATAIITLRLIQNPLMLGFGGYTPFDACQVLLPPISGRKAPNVLPLAYQLRKAPWIHGSGGYIWHYG